MRRYRSQYSESMRALLYIEWHEEHELLEYYAHTKIYKKNWLMQELVWTNVPRE